MRLHLDTDLGSDPDDALALVMVLGWPGVDVVGITTGVDPRGLRAGMVVEVLRRLGRDDVPVAAGAEHSMTTLTTPGGIPEGPPWWPEPVTPRPSSPGAALDRLEASIEAGATVVGIGPFTNLALLEVLRPGRLDQAPVVVMGGGLGLPAAGLPPWGPERDWNARCDEQAAEIVLGTARPTIVPLAATLQVPLAAADLPRLSATGPVGALLADQARAHGAAHDYGELGRAHPGLPDDLVNLHHDPLAVAVALGWDGVGVGQRADGLAEVTEVDAERFSDALFEAIAAAQR